MKASRIVVAGLMAGLVLNILEYVLHGIVLRAEEEAALEAMGLPVLTGGDIAVIVVLTFLIGIALVWLYAAIRPRFGPGMKTAVIAGVFAWALIALLPFIWNSLIPIWPSRPMTISMIADLFFLPIATIAGAWLYREPRVGGVTI